MNQNITEKIIQSHAVDLPDGHVVRGGDMVRIKPTHILTHDNTAAIIPKFQSMGASQVANPSQPVFALDHDIQNTSQTNLSKYAMIQAFAEEQGIAFHSAGLGIGHQMMVERGFVHPGALVVASDSHANMYGALAALGTPVVRTDAAAIWATGTTWWQVPETVKVTLTGELPPGLSGKDLILALCGLYTNGEALNRVVEFSGPGVSSLSIADRLTIANMTTEWGALGGWFPFDGATASYLRQRVARLSELGIKNRLTMEMIQSWEQNPPGPDPDADYAGEITVDLGLVEAMVAGPHTVAKTQSVTSLGKPIRIDKAYLLSCVNSRLEDLAEAAQQLRGKRLADGVELYVAAASADVEEQAKQQGIWQVFQDVGATLFPPGCGACIGLGQGLLQPGENGISATNRNFQGRMGSREAQAFLASPAVVAASAVAGCITTPNDHRNVELPYTFVPIEKTTEPEPVHVLDGFPRTLEGRVLCLPADNLNTDGIYGKDVTYREDLTTEQMASFAMQNYDPEFQQIAQPGDIIVSGRNFGTGSSREQAATALKYRGIQLVIADSFSQTYLRNAFNNAFICLQSPGLSEAVVQATQDEAKHGKRTIVVGRISIDIRGSKAEWNGETYALSPMGPTAQALVLAGGLEAQTRALLEKQ